VSTTPGQSFVRLQAVSKAYDSGSSRLEVLNQVELELPEGETTSLVGRSGSGKSTLLSLIAGLMRPDSGQIYIGGQQMDQLNDDGRASLRAERIGFVLQSDNLIPFLTAVENVELAIGFSSGGGGGGGPPPPASAEPQGVGRPHALVNSCPILDLGPGWIIFRASSPAGNRSGSLSP
jgi:ABC-type glutathione transport system ATPase component